MSLKSAIEKACKEGNRAIGELATYLAANGWPYQGTRVIFTHADLCDLFQRRGGIDAAALDQCIREVEESCEVAR